MAFDFRKKLLDFAMLAVTIMVLVCPIMSTATETDSYTYSCIKLEDSSDKINLKLNQIIESVVSKINQNILKNSKSKFTLTEVFSLYYFKSMFVDDYGQDAFSVFEMCIDTNKCKGWPYFERISVSPQESIYSEANYSSLTKKYLASNIEACGVRFSTDKLTHLLKDGFRYYYAKQNFGYSQEDIERISKFSESTIMGLKSTGVYSGADDVANMNGVRFFEDLLSKHLIKTRNGLIALQPVNICNYIDSRFDERVLKNIYIADVQKNKAIQSAIHKRIEQCSIENRDTILARISSPKSITMTDKFATGFKNISELANSDSWSLKKIMDNFFPTPKDYDHHIY